MKYSEKKNNLKPLKIMQYNPETREQEFKLKDNRTIFKTHNGFKCWVQPKGKKPEEVTSAYYRKQDT